MLCSDIKPNVTLATTMIIKMIKHLQILGLRALDLDGGAKISTGTTWEDFWGWESIIEDKIFKIFLLNAKFTASQY